MGPFENNALEVSLAKALPGPYGGRAGWCQAPGGRETI